MGNVMRFLPDFLAGPDAPAARPRHVVHVGAHEGEEVPWYRQAGIERITLVEPIPELAQALREKFAGDPGIDVVECACSSEPGEAVLHVGAITNMSTLATPGDRDRVAREITVQVRQLADVAPDADMAVIDAQGLELEVLTAAPWDSLQMVIVETCTVDDPTMASRYDDVVALAAAHGFAPATHWTRDYDYVARWARGKAAHPSDTGGEIRDVILVRSTPPAAAGGKPRAKRTGKATGRASGGTSSAGGGRRPRRTITTGDDTAGQ